MIKLRTTNILLALGLVCMAVGQLQQQVEAAGCPFDDSGCKRDCKAQGCQIGYCGNFAWSQCICRKCGSGWNMYDKVTYNSDKTVNQTELDSLQLKGQAPLIVTNSGGDRTTGDQERRDPTTTTTMSSTTSTTTVKQPKQQAATLTTLLIPDLSDTSKLDLNDIPDDENSEKFLDYLTRNHEKLVQAQHSQRQRQQQQLPANENEAGEDEDDSDLQSATTTTTSTTPTSLTTGVGGAADLADEGETVEIQISTSNNNHPHQQHQQQPPVASWGGQRAHDQSGGGQMARLLRMRVADEQQVAEDLELES